MYIAYSILKHVASSLFSSWQYTAQYSVRYSKHRQKICILVHTQCKDYMCCCVLCYSKYTQSLYTSSDHNKLCLVRNVDGFHYNWALRKSN